MDPFKQRIADIEKKAVEVIELQNHLCLLERSFQDLNDRHFLSVAEELERAGHYSDKLCEVRARSRAKLEPEYARLESDMDAAKKQMAILSAELDSLKAIFNLDELGLKSQPPAAPKGYH